MEEESVALRTDAGVLKGTLLNAKAEAPLVVVFRGVAFGRPKPQDAGYLGLAKEIAENGFTTLYVSFRGWSEDADTVMAYAHSLGHDSVVLVGASAGAAIALRHVALHGGVSAVASLASEALFDKTILRSYVPEFMRKVAQAAPPQEVPSETLDPDVFYADMLEHDPIRFVAEISPIPLLLVQGDRDEFVTVETASRLYEAAAQPKELAIVPGAGHVLRRDPRAVDLLVHWLHSVTESG